MREDIQGLQGDVRSIIILGTIVFLILGGFIISFILLYRFRKNKMLFEKDQMKISFQQELLRTQLEIQEQTLKNISQEIHDNIGQMLSLAKLTLATTDLDQMATARQKIDDTHHLISKAIRDLRDLSRSLNTEYLAELGLLRSIEYELEMIGKTGSVKTALTVTGMIYKLNPQKELILFRIVQETLNNILKHANADLISIVIGYHVQGITLKIADNGKGFELLTTAERDNRADFRKPGLGIRNMQNRAKLIGADFKISSVIGEGTEIIIESFKEELHANATF
jgi:two-component system, NarL family, sensor kinase